MSKRRRNSLRREGWHYGAVGYYFITICTNNRDHIFNEDELRIIAENMWRAIPAFKSATKIVLDEWVVMPNHVHGIIIIFEGYWIDEMTPTKTISGTIGSLVGTYKSAVTRRINKAHQTTGRKIWQRGYHDRIIRNESELFAVREYIKNNPIRWAEDKDNLDAMLSKMTKR